MSAVLDLDPACTAELHISRSHPHLIFPDIATFLARPWLYYAHVNDHAVQPYIWDMFISARCNLFWHFRFRTLIPCHSPENIRKLDQY